MRDRRTPLKFAVLAVAVLSVAVTPVFSADVLKFGATARNGVAGQTISIPVIVQDNTLTPAGYDRVGVDEKMQYIAFKMIFTGGLVATCSANATNCRFVEAGIAPTLSPTADPNDPCDALDAALNPQTPVTPCYWRSETKTPAGGDTTNSFSYIVAFQNPLATTDTSTVRGNLVGYIKVKMAAPGAVTPVIQDAAFLPNPPGDPSVNAYLSGYDIYSSGACLWCADASTEETIANTSLALASYRPADTEPDGDVDATDLTNVITTFKTPLTPPAPVGATNFTKDCDGDGVITGKDILCVFYELNPRDLTTASGRTSILDIDLNGAKSGLSDGVLFARYLGGARNTTLIQGNPFGTGANRIDSPSIEAYILAIRPSFDVDGNGTISGLSDGILIRRYLGGARGTTLIQGNPFGAGATRTAAADIEAFIAQLINDYTP